MTLTLSDADDASLDLAGVRTRALRRVAGQAVGSAQQCDLRRTLEAISELGAEVIDAATHIKGQAGMRPPEVERTLWKAVDSTLAEVARILTDHCACKGVTTR